MYDCTSHWHFGGPMVPTLSQIVSSFRMPGPARFSNNNINGQFLSPKGDATISRGGYSIITSTTVQLLWCSSTLHTGSKFGALNLHRIRQYDSDGWHILHNIATTKVFTGVYRFVISCTINTSPWIRPQKIATGWFFFLPHFAGHLSKVLECIHTGTCVSM